MRYPWASSKRYACCLILICIMLCVLFAASSDESSDADESNKCGDNLTWAYDSASKELRIEGKGPMYDYKNAESVPWNAYAGSIVKLSLPPEMTSIGNRAFEDCVEIAGKLNIPSNVTKIGNHAFFNCQKLSGTLAIPDGVILIDDSAFTSCAGFTGDLIIPDSVETIGPCAFMDCKGFSGSLVIGNGVTEIADYAFEGCSGFRGSITLGENVGTLGKSVFSYCRGFTGSLTIPKSLTDMGETPFTDMGSLSAFSVDPDNPVFCSDNGVIFSKDKTVLLAAPAGMRSSSYGVPDTVITIGDYAFCDCIGLTGELTIPKSVEVIGVSAFNGCGGLTGELGISENVKVIGMCAFKGCTGFSGPLTLPDGIGAIDQNAFGDCSGVTGPLILPGSLTKVGNRAFEGCTGILSITIDGECRGMAWNAFSSHTFYEDDGTTKIEDLETGLIGHTFAGKRADKMVLQVPHKVIYDINGGSGSAPIQDDVEYGEEFIVQPYSGTKDGFSFDGWSYDGETYGPGDRIIMGTDDITLVAVWKESKSDDNSPMMIIFVALTIAVAAIIGFALHKKR